MKKAKLTLLLAGIGASALGIGAIGLVSCQKDYVDIVFPTIDGIKFVTDERIVDGYNYATFFKYFRRLVAHPEVLDNPPEEVNRDID